LLHCNRDASTNRGFQPFFGAGGSRVRPGGKTPSSGPFSGSSGRSATGRARATPGAAPGTAGPRGGASPRGSINSSTGTHLEQVSDFLRACPAVFPLLAAVRGIARRSRYRGSAVPQSRSRIQAHGGRAAKDFGCPPPVGRESEKGRAASSPLQCQPERRHPPHTRHPGNMLVTNTRGTRHDTVAASEAAQNLENV
jgi:hypothetical protein